MGELIPLLVEDTLALWAEWREADDPDEELIRGVVGMGPYLVSGRRPGDWFNAETQECGLAAAALGYCARAVERSRLPAAEA